MNNNNNDELQLDVNDILHSMSEQIAKQSQEIAVLNATISAMKKKNIQENTVSEEK